MQADRKVVELDINDVLPNRFQPRIKFNESSIQELSESIKRYGVIQPIVVRKIGDKYEIIAGERRYKASVLAEKTSIPAIICDLNDKDSVEIALIENVQREDLTPIEKAISYKKILDMGYMNQDDLAVKVGKSQSSIANTLRLLGLAEEVQEALLESKISERHARSLLKLKDEKKQVEMLNKIIEQRLTVRRTDEEIEKMIDLKKDKPITIMDEDVSTQTYDVPQTSVYESPVVGPYTPYETPTFENTYESVPTYEVPEVPVYESPAVGPVESYKEPVYENTYESLPTYEVPAYETPVVDTYTSETYEQPLYESPVVGPVEPYQAPVYENTYESVPTYEVPEVPVYETPVVDTYANETYEQPVYGSTYESVPTYEVPEVPVYETPVVDTYTSETYEQPVYESTYESVPTYEVPEVPVYETPVSEPYASEEYAGSVSELFSKEVKEEPYVEQLPQMEEDNQFTFDIPKYEEESNNEPVFPEFQAVDNSFGLPSFMDVDKIEENAQDINEPEKPLANIEDLLKADTNSVAQEEPTEEPEDEEVLKPGRFFSLFKKDKKEEVKEEPQEENNFDFNSFYENDESNNDTMLESMPSETPVIESFEIPTLQEEVTGLETKTNDIQLAINTIRECASTLEKYGFKVNVEEIDLEDSYQAILKIDKM